MNSKYTNMDAIDAMLRVVQAAHQGQKTDDGADYFLHPVRVFSNPHFLMQISDAQELLDVQCAALGHDLFEDTQITADTLHEMGFNRRVTQLISLLTHQPGVPLTDYWQGIRGDRSATLIKLSDIAHNTNPYRKGADAKKSWKRSVKYANAIRYLLSGVNDLTVETADPDDVWAAHLSNVMRTWTWNDSNPLIKLQIP